MVLTENETTKLESVVVSDISRVIIAFANTRGGTLHVGISGDGTVTGVADPDAAMQQISHMVRDNIRPDVSMFVRYETREADGRTILAVTVQPGTGRPYYLAAKGLRPGGVYVRSGTSTNPATDAAIRHMIEETDGDSFEARRSLVQDLNFSAAERQFAQCGVPLDPLKMQSLGLISQDGLYSNTAWLLSDQCGITIRAAVFSGTDKSDFQDRREFTGSLFHQMEELYAWLDRWNRTSSTFSGLYRQDRRDYPEKALREALINAVVHRDYAVGASTLVSVYADRIEFVSPGGLYGGITIDDILLGLSLCRNPTLADIFYRLKLIEAHGTGLPRILSAYRESSLIPAIAATDHAFKITLPNRNAAEAPLPPEEKPDNEENILDDVSTQDPIAQSESGTLPMVSQATASRILKRLVMEGQPHQEGAGRSTRYRKR